MFAAPLIGMALLSALVAGALAWGVARRYGRRRGAVVPLLAVAAAGVTLWRDRGLDVAEAVDRIALALALAGPSVAGALLGVALARTGGR